jgi:hypothetical protein
MLIRPGPHPEEARRSVSKEYVGVAGVDKKRIVQVGVSDAKMKSLCK